MTPSHPPVVLVHGFMSTPKLMWPLKKILEKSGLHVSFCDLSFLCIQDVRKLAAQVQRRVEQICLEQGVEEVDLVGLSQGGVIGLCYLKILGGSVRVRRFIAVGAPVQGTAIARVATLALGLISKGVWQVWPESELIRSLEGPLPQDVDVLSVSIEGDSVCPPQSCRIEGARKNIVVQTGGGPLKHQMVVLSPKVLKLVRDLVLEPSL